MRLSGGGRLVIHLSSVLLVAAGLISSAAADSIYYRKEKDGAIRLTNAPDEKGYHTYLAGTPLADRSVYGPYSEPIQSAASQYGVDPNLVRAVIATESNFDPRAISSKGARGLMQLMPSTATRFGVRDIEDPGQNIRGGVQYLRYLLDLFGGDLVLALAAYNAGEKVVQSTGRVPNFQETREYVDRVLIQYGRPRTDRGGRADGVSAAPAPLAKRTHIYKNVADDGTLVFSDSPIRKSD